MSGHDEPNADDPVEALLDGAAPGTPFGDEVERHLNRVGGPVRVDEAQVRAAARSIHARLAAERPARSGRSAPSARPSWAPRAIVAGLLAAAALLVASPLLRSPAEVAPPTPSAEEPAVAGGFEMRSGSLLAVRGDLIVLDDGVVAVSREPDAAPGPLAPHRVRLPSLGLTVEPIGTVFYAGAREDVGAVWVSEGRVRLLHDTQGDLGVVEAGGWALVSRSADGVGVVVRRAPEGAIDPATLGLEPGTTELMADIRWMALPPETRAGILEP